MDVDKDILEEYDLLGKLMGIAFYNGIALDINFCSIIYKKLLASSVTLDDVKKYDPELGQGLEKLLEFEGDVKEVYQRNFEIELCTPTGNKVLINLVPNGNEIPVTEKNRQGNIYFNGRLC
jgi:ubiquitin-protein ligase E3 A